LNRGIRLRHRRGALFARPLNGGAQANTTKIAYGRGVVYACAREIPRTCCPSSEICGATVCDDRRVRSYATFVWSGVGCAGARKDLRRRGLPPGSRPFSFASRNVKQPVENTLNVYLFRKLANVRVLDKKSFWRFFLLIFATMYGSQIIIFAFRSSWTQIVYVIWLSCIIVCFMFFLQKKKKRSTVIAVGRARCVTELGL